MLQRGVARHLLLLYVVRRVEAADEARLEQLLPMATAHMQSAEIASHPDPSVRAETHEFNRTDTDKSRVTDGQPLN